MTDLYRFFDFHVGISSDEPDFPLLFGRMFPRFRIDSPGRPHEPKVLLELSVLPGPHGKDPRIRCGRKHFRLAPPPWRMGHAFSLALGTIFDQVSTHFMLHGGVVSSDGGGIILSGPSSTGKTTLVLELVRRGLGYLSDDVAPLGRESRLLAPFPKSAAVREGTLALLGLDPLLGSPSPPGRGFGAKRCLDMGDLPGARIGTPCPVRLVLFLQGGDQEEDHIIDIGILDGSNPLPDELSNLPGVELISSHDDEGIRVARFRLSRKTRPTRAVLKLLGDHRDAILYAEIAKTAGPDFDRAPVLRSMSPSEGVAELMRDMKNRTEDGMLFAECGGRLTRLYVDLAEALAGASFFRLAPGAPGRTADLICSKLICSKTRKG